MSKRKEGKHAAPAPVVKQSQPTPAVKQSQPVPGYVRAPQGKPHRATIASNIPQEGKGRKRALISLGVLVAVLAVMYLAGVFVFSGRFFPNTTISHLDISLKTPTEVSAILDDAVGGYDFEVSGQGLDLKLSAAEIGMVLDSETVSNDVMKDVNAWAWPVEVFRQHDESEAMVATYGTDKLVAAVTPAVDLVNEQAIWPQDATIGFDDKLNAFSVVPETYGTALDAEKVADQVLQGTKTLSPNIVVTKDATVQPQVFEDDPRLDAAVDEANVMIKADLEIVMEGNLVTEVTPELISSWVTVSPEVEVTFDDAAFSTWVDGVCSGCNTVGTERTYTRLDGKSVTVSGGVYGWEVDGASLRTMVTDAVRQGTVGSIDVPVLQSGNGYSGLGDKDWGARYCDIDLSEQHAYFYDDEGALVWESDIVTGSPGKHATPTGVWQATWGKASPSKLIGEKDPETGKPEYETTVSYWMPFVGNSIGLHDATWQSAFGGTRYSDGYGSHGCVNLPLEEAKALYDIIQPGDVVVVHW